MALPTTMNTPRPIARGYGVRINDLFLRLHVTPDTPIERSTAPRQPQRVDTRQNIDEFISDEYATVFARNDVTGGEGLDFAYSFDNTELDRTRFWDSYGIDVTPGQSGRMSSFHLLHDISEISDTGNFVTSLGDKVFISVGVDLYVTSDPFSASPTVSAESPHLAEGSTTITSLLRFGGHVYAGVGDGVHRSDGDGTWEHWSDKTVNRMWGVKGRILASSGNELYELKATTGSTLIFTLPSDTSSFRHIVDAGTFILAAANDGTIYSFTFNEDDLSISVVARTPILNETPMTVGYRAGVALIGTLQTVTNGVIARLYQGVLNQDGTLTLDLIRQWGNSDTTIEYDISSITITRDYAYVGVYEGPRGHVWKYDFSTRGLFRNIGDEGIGQITDLTIHQGRLLFASSGIYVETDTYLETGSLISPLVDFLVPEKKSWVGVSVDTESVTSPERVTISHSTNPADILDVNSSSWLRGHTVTQGRNSEFRIIKAEPSRYIALKVTLEGDGTTTPYVNAFAVKAYPGPGDLIMRIPVNVSDNVEFPNHRKKRIRGYGEKVYDRLRTFQDSSVEVELLKPKERIRGIIEEISDRIPANQYRGSATYLAYITVRGRRFSLAGASESGAAIGIGNIGIIAIGGHRE